jgi:hypothetical protein
MQARSVLTVEENIFDFETRWTTRGIEIFTTLTL